MMGFAGPLAAPHPQETAANGGTIQDVIAQLAPTQGLPAGITLRNVLLVSGRSAEGDPQGIAPDMARGSRSARGSGSTRALLEVWPAGRCRRHRVV
jgi:hypothetical protein